MKQDGKFKFTAIKPVVFAVSYQSITSFIDYTIILLFKILYLFLICSNLFSELIKVDKYCEDTDNGTTGIDGMSCNEYRLTMCDWKSDEDDDFDARAMCCICGGGIRHGNNEYLQNR